MTVAKNIAKRIRTGFRTALLAGGILFGWVNISCSRVVVEEQAIEVTTPEKLELYRLFLPSEASVISLERRFQPWQTWLAFSYTPLEVPGSADPVEPSDDDAGRDEPEFLELKVKPTPTPWAEAFDRESIVLELNEILLAHGIDSANVRVRMIAHAIVASGWKQKVWNYNAWGVKQGAWKKSWYVMPTYEEDDSGAQIYVEDATWRAFDSWDESIQDFLRRISAESIRPSYRQAHRYLVSDRVNFRTAKEYWEALGDGNYYTARKFTGEKFARLCGGVRSILRSSGSI